MLTVSEKLRTSESLRRFVETGRSQKEDVVEGMEAGADDFVTKPFDRDELRVRLRVGERVCELERRLAEQSRELEELREKLAER